MFVIWNLACVLSVYSMRGGLIYCWYAHLLNKKAYLVDAVVEKLFRFWTYVSIFNIIPSLSNTDVMG